MPRRRCSPTRDELHVLIPPEGLDLSIATLDDALGLAVDIEVLGLYPTVLVVAGDDGRVLFCVATDRTLRLSVGEALLGVAGSVIPFARVVAITRVVTDLEVDCVAERDLVRWRHLRALATDADVDLADWIIVGPAELRSIAVTAGDAPVWWEEGMLGAGDGGFR